MLLNSAKSQHLHFVPNTPPNLLLPKLDLGVFSLLQVHCTKDIGMLINCLLSPSLQINVAVMKAEVMLASLLCTFRRFSSHLFSFIVLRNSRSSP